MILAPSVGGNLSLRAGFATAMASTIVGMLLTSCFPETAPSRLDADGSLLDTSNGAGTPAVLRRSSLPWSHDARTEGSSAFESRMLRPDLAMRILLSDTMFRSLSVCIICSTMVIGGIQGTFFLFVEAQLK